MNLASRKKLPFWPHEEDVAEFLTFSNLIEGVSGLDALYDAVCAWNYLLKKDRVDLQVLLHVHKLLMKRLNPRIAGKLRMVDVRVGPRVCPAHELISGLLSEWLYQVNDIKKNSDLIMVEHIAFERIHPFEDGNGRVGRLLLNWQRLRSKMPIMIIHTGAEQMAYYGLFEEPTWDI